MGKIANIALYIGISMRQGRSYYGTLKVSRSILSVSMTLSDHVKDQSFLADPQLRSYIIRFDLNDRVWHGNTGERSIFQVSAAPTSQGSGTPASYKNVKDAGVSQTSYVSFCLIFGLIW